MQAPNKAMTLLGLGPELTRKSIDEAFYNRMKLEFTRPGNPDSTLVNQLISAKVELDEYVDMLRAGSKPATESNAASQTQFSPIMKYIIEGTNNLLIHGGAGTGKSTYIRELVNHIDNFVVVAPTGTAALNLGEVVGASTIHSLFGFKLGLLGSDTTWVQKISSQRREKLALIETLVIDEISMVNADVIDAIDLSLQFAKKKKRPFGGVRLIMVGDLFQLPPVLNHNDKDLVDYVKRTYGSFWFFRAKAWDACDFDTLILEENLRQKEDPTFQVVLNRLRRGNPEPAHIDWLNTHVISDLNPSEQSIRIVGTNKEAAEVNTSKLQNLIEEPKQFLGEWEEITPLTEAELARFKKEIPVDETLTLKIGAQVMFVKNDDQNTDGKERRWVNGSMGIVTGFTSNGVFVRIGKEPPIIVGVSKWEFVRHEIEEEFVEQTGRVRQVLRPVPCLTYEQLPLDLGWAITTHKSQGKTYDSAVISIGSMSKYPGHSYVALSRVRTSSGLCLTRKVSKTDFPCDDEVVGFLMGQPRTLATELGR